MLYPEDHRAALGVSGVAQHIIYWARQGLWTEPLGQRWGGSVRTGGRVQCGAL